MKGELPLLRYSVKAHVDPYELADSDDGELFAAEAPAISLDFQYLSTLTHINILRD